MLYTVASLMVDDDAPQSPTCSATSTWEMVAERYRHRTDGVAEFQRRGARQP